MSGRRKLRRLRATEADSSDGGTKRLCRTGSAHIADVKMVTDYSILKSSSMYGPGPTETRNCDIQSSSSVLTVASIARLLSQQIAAVGPWAVIEEVMSSVGTRAKCLVIAIQSLAEGACIYDTGGHTKKDGLPEWMHRRWQKC